MLARFALLKSLRGYQAQWLQRDIAAGLAVAAVAIPSAIAYPAIAGLPPEVGVYSSILPLIGYALFGPSRQLMVGPDAATMTVLAGVLATASLNGSGDRVVMASALAVSVGVLCIAGSKLHLGVVAAFLSRPILVGFISGVSISIIIGQIGRFTGLKIEADGLVAPLWELLNKAGSINWPSVALGVAMFVILQAMSLRASIVPGPLVVVLLSLLASLLLDFPDMGIRLVGSLPEGLPRPSIPIEKGLPINDLALGAAAVWLVSFGSGAVAARSFAARGKFDVDVDAELLGLGAANVACGLFSGFPVTVSDSRTAINMSVGGRTQLVGLVAAAALTVMLLFLNGALSLLPTPALGAILMAAAISLIDLSSLREIWRISKMEFAFAMIGMVGPISLGVLKGVVIAVAATLLYVLLKEMRPRDALLGRIHDRAGFYKLHRAHGAQPIPGLAVCLIEGSLLFFNVDYLKSRLERIADGLPQGTKWFVIDASAIVQADSTAAQMLEDLQMRFAERGISLGIAELHKEPMEILERAGLLQKIGKSMLFEDLEDVARAFAEHSASGSSPRDT